MKVTLIATCILFLSGNAVAQTTQPAATQPSGFQMTPELRARMERMNRAAVAAASQPTAEASQRAQQDAAARRLAYIAAHQARADLLMQLQQRRAATAQIVAEIDQQIAALQVQGRAAQEELSRLIGESDAAVAAAKQAGTYDIFGWIEDDHGRQSQVTGTLDSPAARLAAIQQADQRYSPAIADGQRQVLSLYQEYQSLLKQRAELLARP